MSGVALHSTVATGTRLTGKLLVCAPDARGALAATIAALQAAGVADIALAVPSHGGESQLPLDGISVLTFDLAPDSSGLLPWFTQPDVLRGIVALAVQAGADACLLVGTNYALLAPEDLRTLAHALLADRCAAVVPLYALRPTEGLVNTAILYPLTRALYGRQVRYPLAADMGASVELLRRAAGVPSSSSRDRAVILPVEATTAGMTLCEARVSSRPLQQAEGRDLAAVLESVAGPVFSDMEQKAPLWQRVRGSQPVKTIGEHTFDNAQPTTTAPPDADLARLVENFSLATRNLIEEWGLVMPPTSQVGIKRLSRATVGEFHFPNELWARVVYDFALAHRTRTISRNHLFGAFMPLYLGWVASFLSQPVETAAQRIEDMCRAFEAEKPYLLQRWRWPDRFTP